MLIGQSSVPNVIKSVVRLNLKFLKMLTILIYLVPVESLVVAQILANDSVTDG